MQSIMLFIVVSAETFHAVHTYEGSCVVWWLHILKSFPRKREMKKSSRAKIGKEPYAPKNLYLFWSQLRYKIVETFWEGSYAKKIFGDADWIEFVFEFSVELGSCFWSCKISMSSHCSVYSIHGWWLCLYARLWTMLIPVEFQNQFWYQSSPCIYLKFWADHHTPRQWPML